MKETLLDAFLAVVLGLAFAVLALAYFDVLIYWFPLPVDCKPLFLGVYGLQLAGFLIGVNMTFYKAKLLTINFEFEAFGTTEEKAIEVLKKGLYQHSIDYQIDEDWWHDYQDDIYAIEVGLDGCYWDNEPIFEK